MNSHDHFSLAQTGGNKHVHQLFASVGIAFTFAQVVMLWSYRYLPMYDYPIWLYTVQCVRELLGGNQEYLQVFRFASAPIPNLAFPGATLALSYLFSLETAGKILVSVCIVGFPWCWLFTVRRLVVEQGGLEYLGFPMALNIFLWGRISYLLAFILFIPAVGWLVAPRTTLRGLQWLLVGSLSVVFFFLHGAVLALWSLVVIVMLFSTSRSFGSGIRQIAITLGLSALLALWYLIGVGESESAELTWGTRVLARNLLKPLMLFVKSYGVPSFLPLSVCNGAWLLLLAMCVLPAARALARGKRSAHPIRWAALGCLVAAVFLPNDALGINSPGGYCVLPALFLIIIASPRSTTTILIPSLLFVTNLVLTLHAFDHVNRVDAMMTEFVKDIRDNVPHSSMHTTIGYDWPPETGACDALSASVNPLFGAHHYVLLEAGGLAAIHETSILRMRPEYSWIQPVFSGGTREDFHKSVLRQINWCNRFSSVAVTGRNREAGETIERLRSMGFNPVCERKLWTILAKDSSK